MFRAKVEVNRFILIMLLVMMVAGLFYFLNQLAKYYEKLNALQITLAESEKERVLLSKENEVLITEKASLNAEITGLSDTLGQLQGLLNQANVDKKALRDDITRMTAELTALKEDLRLWEGRINNLSETQFVLANKQRSAVELRKRINALKTRAQREIDQYKSQFGNHGFVIKEKQSTLIRDRIKQFEGKVDRIDLKKIIVKPGQNKPVEAAF